MNRLLLSLFAISWLLLVPPVTHAVTAGNLEVLWPSGNTIFGTNAAIAPGYSVTKDVTVTNHGSSTETVYTEPSNYSSTGLADALELTISATSTGATYFNDRYTAFFQPTPVSLGDLGAGVTRTYQFTTAFASSSGNSYQGKSIGFDLVVGFAGGSSVNSGGGGGNGGGGGGSTIPPAHGYFPTTGASTTTSPQGSVLGASTTRSYPAVINTLRQHAAASPLGQVLGLGTTTSSTAAALTTGNSTPTKAATTTETAACTLVWLLCLGLISLSWTLYHDWFSLQAPIQRRLFTFNLLTHAGYLLVVAGLWFTGGLTTWWWIPALAWLALVAADSVWHHRLSLDPALLRFRHYAGASVLFIALALLVGVPCTWWPFALVLGVSIGIWRWPRSVFDDQPLS